MGPLSFSPRTACAYKKSFNLLLNRNNLIRVSRADMIKILNVPHEI